MNYERKKLYNIPFALFVEVDSEVSTNPWTGAQELKESLSPIRFTGSVKILLNKTLIKLKWNIVIIFKRKFLHIFLRVFKLQNCIK